MESEKHKAYMRIAMQEAERSFNENNAPFGVVVVDSKGIIVCKEHDRVKEKMDPTAHAEINAIRKLCKKLKKLSLNEYTFYTTSEPCPTCLTACIKARVSKIYFGADTEKDASLPIKAKYLAKKSKKYPIEVIGGILKKECLTQRNKLLTNL